MVATTTEQLQESQKIQQRLLEDVNEKEHELRHIQEQLDAEKDQKSHLAEELHRTEGRSGHRCIYDNTVYGHTCFGLTVDLWS